MVHLQPKWFTFWSKWFSCWPNCLVICWNGLTNRAEKVVPFRLKLITSVQKQAEMTIYTPLIVLNYRASSTGKNQYPSLMDQEKSKKNRRKSKENRKEEERTSLLVSNSGGHTNFRTGLSKILPIILLFLFVYRRKPNAIMRYLVVFVHIKSLW